MYITDGDVHHCMQQWICESMRHFMHRAGFEWNRYHFGFARVCAKVCAGPCPLTLWILPSPTNFVDRTTNRRRHMCPWVAQMQFWLPVGMRQGMRRHFFSSIHEIAISESKTVHYPSMHLCTDVLSGNAAGGMRRNFGMCIRGYAPGLFRTLNPRSKQKG